MKIDAADLMLVGMVINERGFHIIEGIINRQLQEMQSFEYITGNTFGDGILKGQVSGRKIDLLLFKNLREEIKKMGKTENEVH